MLSILNLALPFFGLIFIGFACGKWKKLPDEGLAWMNFFILYVALPALFFRILSKTPFEQLAQLDFVTATVLATASAFTLAFIIGLILRRGRPGAMRRWRAWPAASATSATWGRAWRWRRSGRRQPCRWR